MRARDKAMKIVERKWRSREGATAHQQAQSMLQRDARLKEQSGPDGQRKRLMMEAARSDHSVPRCQTTAPGLESLTLPVLERPLRGVMRHNLLGERSYPDGQRTREDAGDDVMAVGAVRWMLRWTVGSADRLPIPAWVLS